ncbi:MAG: NADH-quinone oxidoreductase subunit A [Candidatus Marinimicrobia bacterium]|nr:NADH-quinone oxidoreductase subunit A [Candidatus Neomarinimicrobiota bacterium]
MISDYLPVMIVFLLAAGFAVGALIATHFFGPKIKGKIKSEAYESGIEAKSSPHTRLNVRYFIVGLVFVIFDIEVVFLYPWAVVFKDFIKTGPFIFFEMLFFLFILLIGYIYVWRKGVFEWE